MMRVFLFLSILKPSKDLTSTVIFIDPLIRLLDYDFILGRLCIELKISIIQTPWIFWVFNGFMSVMLICFLFKLTTVLFLVYSRFQINTTISNIFRSKLRKERFYFNHRRWRKAEFWFHTLWSVVCVFIGSPCGNYGCFLSRRNKNWELACFLFVSI